ncbi:hypothetical protein V8E54_004711 [Elaphomyces granulatus]|jgi:hypothetical protein
MSEVRNAPLPSSRAPITYKAPCTDLLSTPADTPNIPTDATDKEIYILHFARVSCNKRPPNSDRRPRKWRRKLVYSRLVLTRLEQRRLLKKKISSPRIYQALTQMQTLCLLPDAWAKHLSKYPGDLPQSIVRILRHGALTGREGPGRLILSDNPTSATSAPEAINTQIQREPLLRPSTACSTFRPISTRPSAKIRW